MRAILLVAAGCAVGAPPGFSSGDRWTLPLVDPLSDGRLLTTVYVNGHGPVVFAIDPDAPITVVDQDVIGDERSAHEGPRVIDELDVSHPRFYVPLGSLRVGDLTIKEPTVELSEHPGVFDERGRHVSGILGKDVLADSLVFGFDRDRGIAWLETHDVFHAPTEAAAIHYHTGSPRRPDLVIRKLASARVGSKTYDLHVDLGDVSSQLRRDDWGDAGDEFHEDLVDETGTHRSVDSVARRSVSVDGVGEQVGFVDYVDHRWSTLPGEPDGTLGLDFFRRYSVIADWHHEVVYMTPRHDDDATRRLRLSRWAGLSADVRVEVADSRIIVSRQGGGPLEVVLASPATAPGTVLPHLYVEMPAGVDRIEAALEPRYASLEVVDANPLLRACPSGAGCVLTDSPLPP